MPKELTIKDLYAGKPDAKDEFYAEEFSDFIDSFVIPENIDVERLLDKNDCYITGFKGTGKTAILFYLDYRLKEIDPCAVSSFIFFKEDYSESKRKRFENFSGNLFSSEVIIEKQTPLAGDDFEYLWKWIILQKVLDDNEEYNEGLFEKNEQWYKFVKIMKSIYKLTSKSIFTIPTSFNVSMPIHDPSSGMTISPSLNVNLSDNSTEDFSQFVELVDSAYEIFFSTTRTDIPYYLFLDELEAYMGDSKIFERDLRLIRDLIFVVKKFNSIFIQMAKKVLPFQNKTKMFCAVRTEIINAIQRNIVSKELNKAISGFEFPLSWNYTNTNSIQHPIFRILLKRINIAYKNNGMKQMPDSQIYKKWFPETIENTSTIQYILNNSWNKPRDIVRLLLAIQNGIHSKATKFSNTVFNGSKKNYSKESLNEIQEEMLAQYSRTEINTIMRYLNGFKPIFSKEEFADRISKNFSDNLINSHPLESILSDLYRIGIVGNYSPIYNLYRWHHRGDNEIIISSEWKIIVHSALHDSLSLRRLYRRELKTTDNKDNITAGDFVEVKVTDFSKAVIYVTFSTDSGEHRGMIHISELPKYVYPLESFAEKGEILNAKVLMYDNYKKYWQLTLKHSGNLFT